MQERKSDEKIDRKNDIFYRYDSKKSGRQTREIEKRKWYDH